MSLTTAANRSSAVMQQRAEPHDSLDYFPTPPWAARALCDFLQAELGERLHRQSVWEPAAGEGHLARGLADYFGCTHCSDVHDYTGDGRHLQHDFLFGGSLWPGAIDWIVTNPPFRLGRQFIETALPLAGVGVAMFVRSAFTEGGERYREIFEANPPAFVLQFVERVVLLKGRLIRSNSLDPFNLDADGKPVRASSATSYCWLVWITDDRWIEEDKRDTRHRWLGTPRAQLERDGDYPAYPEQWAKIARSEEGSLL